MVPGRGVSPGVEIEREKTFLNVYVFFFSSRRRHTRSSTVSWARLGLFEQQGESVSITGDALPSNFVS